ncbi:MAG: hypothetical protein DI547_04930 [Sphingobium sp.]|nr:MAG: hypothetical protein DI547_04930 [Sphingobium sp.]
MKNPRFAELGRQGRGPGLSARAAARAAAKPPAEPDDETQPGDEPDDEEDEEMTDTVNTQSKDYQAGQKAAQDAERKRFATVTASEHYAGREKMAARLLNTDMSAEDIVATLADAPAPNASASPSKPDATTQAAAEEESDKKLMRDKLQAKNPDLGDDDEQDEAAKAKANNHGWDKIHAEVDARRNAKA